jgi:pyridoxal phosphate enzyme (YggS family)
MSIADNVRIVRERIQKAALNSGRDPKEVRLIAVTKGVSIEKITEAVRCGIDTFGENYAQEFRNKYEVIEKTLGSKVKWHFIGRLQRNKVKYLLGKVELIHSLDSLTVAEEINKRAQKLGTLVPVLIEVNTSGEKQKGGIPLDELKDFLNRVRDLPSVKIIGLMTMPPYFDNPELTRPYYRKLRELRDELQKLLPDLRELSMGMSVDFEVAIEEGATMVRIGTLIFGPRSV